MQYDNSTGLPSVSDILEPFEDTRWFNESHQVRGNIVHGWIAADLLGLFTPKIPPLYEGYIKSYFLFKPHISEIIIIEKRLTSEKGFCGQVDLVARLDETYNNSIAYIDWKTSKAAYKTWQTRQGGYSILIKEHGIPCEGGVTVRLRGEATNSKGFSPLVDFYNAREMKENEIDFLSTYRVFHNVLNYGKVYASYETISEDY